MRVFLGVLSLLGIIITSQCMTQEEIEYFTGLHRECGITDDVTDRAMAGNFPEDQQFKERLFCVSKKVGMQDEDGLLLVKEVEDQMRRNVPDEEKVNQILSTCMVQLDTPEETAYRAMKCIHKIKTS
uniref:Odorant binding protein 20 n=1 Tax=Xylotrechus quadripes TaxID=554073 RepID=A0A346HGP2_9CUCU|nr:odorant binding protein 20 [Xylotrechus quadripes]